MRNSQIANPNLTSVQQKKIAKKTNYVILLSISTHALSSTAILTPPKRKRSKMYTTEIATIAISVITVSIAIYKAAQKTHCLQQSSKALKQAQRQAATSKQL